jgi:hypothetical protein
MKIEIIGKDLCILDDNTEKIIYRHRPFTKIDEFRKVGPNCIIVREDTTNYCINKSNIYCLDDRLEPVWFSDLPFDGDNFPNEIAWDKAINENGTSWTEYRVNNANSFVCSSWQGFTVTIDYKTGIILKSLFTK